MSQSSRRGFTLVEMLVVITIIGILAAILIPTIGSVIKSGKANAIVMEINQLESALEAYKLANKDYPPDFSNTTAVVNHVQKAYPRSTFQIRQWADPPVASRTGNFPAAGAAPVWPDWQSVNPEGNRLDPAEALVFWLSGLKNNPRNPFGGTGEQKVYFDFKEEQLTDIDGDGWPEYTSPHAQGVPYVYFDGRVQNSGNGGAAVCAYAWAIYPSPWSPPSPALGGPASPPSRLLNVGRDPSNFPFPSSGFLPVGTLDFGVVRPFRSNTVAFDGSGNVRPAESHTYPTPAETANANTTTWLDARKFQILCAGMDHAFGADHIDPTSNPVSNIPVYKTFPATNYYQQSPGSFADDRDNMATFAEGQNLGDALP